MSTSRASKPRPSGRRSSGDGVLDRRPGRGSRSGASAREARVVAADGLPCVWMTAGLLAWRLCDREYDCERCPLDAALAGEHAPPAEAARETLRRGRLEFPGDRLYCASHGWVQRREDARLRLGPDALVGRLLDRISAVVLPAPGNHTVRGQPLCWLVDDGVPVPLASPLSGAVLGANAGLRIDPSLVVRSPYEDGWLLELAADPDRERPPLALSRSADQRRTTAAQLRDLRRRGARLVRRPRHTGPTLCDGGLPVRGLRSRLGTPAYHRLVRRLLG